VITKVEALGSSGGGEGPLVHLDRNQRWTQAAKVRNVLFAEKRKERPHEVIQWDLETSSPLSQIGNWIL
jgi:hypothetical protein